MEFHTKASSAFILLCLSFIQSIKAQQVELDIGGIRSSQGHLIVAVFKDGKSFKQDTPVKRIRVEKTGMANGNMKICLSLAPGTYGIVILDDENDDDKMTTNIIGYPKEGFGFSDFMQAGITRPDFHSFSFEVKNGQLVKVTLRIKYL